MATLTLPHCAAWLLACFVTVYKMADPVLSGVFKWREGHIHVGNNCSRAQLGGRNILLHGIRWRLKYFLQFKIWRLLSLPHAFPDRFCYRQNMQALSGGYVSLSHGRTGWWFFAQHFLGRFRPRYLPHCSRWRAFARC